jgi:hypothetical protein
MKIRFAIAAAIIASGAAVAETPTTITPGQQGKMVVRLWSDSCASHFSNPEAIKAFARSVHLAENPEYSASLLQEGPGTVWDASLGPMLQVALVLLDNGTCRVIAHRADSATVNALFIAILEGTRRTGLEVIKASDTTTTQNHIQFHTIAYYVGAKPASAGWGFTATTTESQQAVHQVVMTVARAARPDKGNSGD